ncbi:MAG: hypothetical protein LBC05_02250 [Endomicrobium sp.]|jgi:hypothetical protein|nr:hypothetical protein [Endomicrobium sp.]
MFGASTVKISYNKLLTRLGYCQSKMKLDSKIVMLIEENLSLAQKIIEPKIAVASDNIKFINNNIVCFENGYTMKSRNVAYLLRNCFMAYGVCVTVGSKIESKRDEFLKIREIFKALILDSAGSVAAEETISIANLRIETYEKNNGNMLTKRYSPGYGDWVLESNKDFLNWIGSEQIGVSLNKFYHMNPEKSVSALIGVNR